MNEQVTDNPKKAYGDAKPSIHTIPMGVMLKVANVMKLGAKKYGVRNWRKQPIHASTYYNAMYRHLIGWYEALEDKDAESQETHLAHLIAGAIIVIDAQDHNTLLDDRDFSEVLVK